MTSRSELEGFVDRSGFAYREVDESTWILRSTSDGEENIVMTAMDPLLLFRVKVMDAPTADRGAFYEKLLELNATELVHCAYGIADGAVMLSSALILATADYEEFQGTLDEIALTLAKHYDLLQPFRGGQPNAG